MCSKSLQMTDFGIQKKKKKKHTHTKKQNLRVFRFNDCECAQCCSLRSAAKQTQDKR